MSAGEVRKWQEGGVRRYVFEESIGYWLCGTSNALQKVMNEELAGHGITYRQWQVLAWLVFAGEMSQIELAGHMMIEPPTLVGLLDRMEQQGWIRRINCPDDRRKKMVQIAPAAEAVWEKMVDASLQARARALNRLTPEQTRQLISLLQLVQAGLHDCVPADPEPVSDERAQVAVALPETSSQAGRAG